MRARAVASALLAAAALLTLPATAAASTKLLSVATTGSGTGTVQSSPEGINCGTTCSSAFAEGTTVTLTATPGPNTAPAQWTGCDSLKEGKCLVTMSGPRSVTASFKIAQHQLTVTKAGTSTGTVQSSPAGINCGTTCSASFAEGTTVTLTATPGPNSAPVKWTGCDSLKEGKCLVAISEAREVTATFDLEGPELAITTLGSGTGSVQSSPSGIECPSACAAKFLKGTTITLTATPGPHSLPPQWSGCEPIPPGNKCKLTLNSDTAISVVFNLERQWISYPVSVREIGTGQGSVKSIPAGIQCPGACNGEYLFDSLLTLLAEPTPGSVLDHWSIGTCGASLSCTTTIRSARVINVVFTAVGNRTLTVAKAGSGQGTVISTNVAGIECGSVCSAELGVKTKVTLKATPAPGSTFTGWSGEGCTGSAACHVQMNEARNITATFTKLPAGPSELLIAGRVKVKAGRALLKLACEGGSPCNGSLKLALAKGKGKGVLIAQGSYSLAPGARQTLAIKLSAKARRLLTGATSLRAIVSGTGIDTHGLRLAA